MVPTITSNFIAWSRYQMKDLPLDIQTIDTRPDRLAFEDPTGSVMRFMLGQNGLVQTPSNHGTWVVQSIRERRVRPSAQLVVCRRLNAVTGLHDLFYSIDFDKSPWDPKRLNDACCHSWEVFWNKITGNLTNQVTIAEGLLRRGIPQLA